MKNTLVHWTPKAERLLRTVLREASKQPGLRRLGPFGASQQWSASVRLVGATAMTRLNGHYRGKRYATDVLSFTAPAVFQRTGQLGELVICLPTAVKQARERDHEVEKELRVLLVHGLLHLLGLDHERGPRQAAVMARWESRLLPARLRGLVVLG